MNSTSYVEGETAGAVRLAVLLGDWAKAGATSVMDLNLCFPFLAAYREISYAWLLLPPRPRGDMARPAAFL